MQSMNAFRLYRARSHVFVSPFSLSARLVRFPPSSVLPSLARRTDPAEAQRGLVGSLGMAFAACACNQRIYNDRLKALFLAGPGCLDGDPHSFFCVSQDAGGL